MKSTIDKCLIDVLGKNFDAESNLRKDLRANDLDMVELVILIEARLDIEIVDEEFEKIKTVNQLYDYVSKKKDK